MVYSPHLADRARFSAVARKKWHQPTILMFFSASPNALCARFRLGTALQWWPPRKGEVITSLAVPYTGSMSLLASRIAFRG
jgi:hypothetical protein